MATGALPGEWLRLKFPALAGAASRACETIRPTKLGEVSRARALVRKPTVEVGPGHGAVMFPPAFHKNIIGTLPPVSTESYALAATGGVTGTNGRSLL
jgi:hypothetical protein